MVAQQATAADLSFTCTTLILFVESKSCSDVVEIDANVVAVSPIVHCYVHSCLIDSRVLWQLSILLQVTCLVSVVPNDRKARIVRGQSAAHRQHITVLSEML